MDWLKMLRFFYLFCVTNALFFSALIFSKKDKTAADKVLVVWLLTLSAQLFITSLTSTDFPKFSHLLGNETLFYLFQPIFLYLYVKTMVGKLRSLKTFILNIILTNIIELGILIFLWISSKSEFQDLQGDLSMLVFITFILITIGYFVYNIYSSYQELMKYRNDMLQIYSYREQVDLHWLCRLIVYFIVIAVFVFPLDLVFNHNNHSILLAKYIFPFTLVAFIYFLGHWGHLQGKVLSLSDLKNEGSHPYHGLLSFNTPTEGNIQYQEELELLREVMETQKPFLDPELSILELAELVNIHPQLLLEIITQELQSNFFEFINTYRINEFKQKAIDPAYQHHTTEDLAMSCGFKSKLSFHRIFKDNTGFTLENFIKKHNLQQ